MKLNCRIAGSGLVFLTAVWAALFLLGCQTHTYQKLPGDVPGPAETIGKEDVLSIGDSVVVHFTGPVGGDPILPQHTETIKEDGNINPPLVGPVKAVGRTPGDLQKDLQEKYKAYYRNLTVTVISAARYYYVSGEVRKPGPQPYLGRTDIVKAISAAGDFTDFASKRRVRITRTDGRTEIVNVGKIQKGTRDDVPIYPGDKILVKRRFF